MNNFNNSFDFPSQRVSHSTRENADWYCNCIDWIIGAGVAFNDKKRYERNIDILHGNIPEEYYKKTLNPYNATDEKYQRFPATMRNLDMVNSIVRRYVSEYYKGQHQFMVSANNPDIVLNKERKLREQIGLMAQQAFAAEFQRKYQEAVNEAQQNGEDPEQINPQDMMPNIDEFIKDFEENYIDDETKQGQDVLEYVRSMTKDEVIYLKAYFDFVTVGECYSYADVRGNSVHKEVVPVEEAYPIPNNEQFVEDHDMFARKMMLSYPQILDMFDDYLTSKDRNYLEKYYGHHGNSTENITRLDYTGFFEHYADVCSKYNKEDREFFQKNPVSIYSGNNNLYEVWHVVWKGQIKQGILTYVNEMGLETQMIVDEVFKFDESLGHINIEWIWTPQVYEGYRIGGRHGGIYPIKSRAIACNRDGKLPYNGIMELLPNFGKFSIVELVSPFQVFRNIINYHQEMVIAKNKLLILVMAKSLLGENAEDTIYKLAADGTLLYDDEEDSNGIKAQQIRLLNANLGQYITELSNLKESIKNEGWEVVDMTPQRFGEIAASAGKATTEEAINRGSMGSVIVVFAFDEFRRADYQRDIDFAKIAFAEGLEAGYNSISNEHKYISLDVNTFLMSDYGLSVRNDAKERDKFEQLKQWAFSAAQNGDIDMALAAITADNVAAAKAIITKFNEIKRKHEEDMQQADQMLKQQEIESKLQQIQAQGEEDRKTQEMKYYYEMQLRYIDVDLNLLHHTSDSDTEGKNTLARELEAGKRDMERMKMDIEREKIMADNYNKAADRNVQREKMKNDLTIARTNKNKYDK